VTGASSGIGRALALRLAREGARVALVARRAGELEAAAARITAAGGEALVLPCDVCDRDQVSSACEQALARFGAVDLLVNNAGYGRHRRFVDWDLDDMERMLRVNVLGALSFTKELLPRMVERRRGWLVFMASIAGQIAPPEESVYAASKFALVGFAESLSLEVEDAGVHVLTVCPATVRTPFFDAGTLRRLPPVARRAMVEPEALAEAIVAALAAGRHQLVFPRRFRAACIVRSLAPGFTRRQVKRHALGPARSTGPEGHR
jgi:3-oxoacyl-[acyl-carrier protein] reductase